jgi:hypothetical protein
MLLQGFTPDTQSLKLIYKGLSKWLAVEWKSMFLRIPAGRVLHGQRLAPVSRR